MWGVGCWGPADSGTVAGATLSGLPAGTLYRVRATYRYTREDSDELSFDVGDVIRVVEYDDPEEQVLCLQRKPICSVTSGLYSIAFILWLINRFKIVGFVCCRKSEGALALTLHSLKSQRTIFILQTLIHAYSSRPNEEKNNNGQFPVFLSIRWFLVIDDVCCPKSRPFNESSCEYLCGFSFEISSPGGGLADGTEREFKWKRHVPSELHAADLRHRIQNNTAAPPNCTHQERWVTNKIFRVSLYEGIETTFEMNVFFNVHIIIFIHIFLFLVENDFIDFSNMFLS